MGVKQLHLDGCEHDPDPANLRFDDEAGWWLSNLEYWGLAGGKLAFECDGKTIRFARCLDTQAAQRIATQLST